MSSVSPPAHPTLSNQIGPAPFSVDRPFKAVAATMVKRYSIVHLFSVNNGSASL